MKDEEFIKFMKLWESVKSLPAGGLEFIQWLNQNGFDLITKKEKK